MASAAPRNLFESPWSGLPRSSGHLRDSSISKNNARARRPELNEPILIRITQTDHEILIQMSQRYTNLRSNLIALGADPDIIERYSNESSVLPDDQSGGRTVPFPSLAWIIVDHPEGLDAEYAVSSSAGSRKPMTKPMSARADVFCPLGLRKRVSKWVSNGDDADGHVVDSLENGEPPVSDTPSNTEAEAEQSPRPIIPRHARRSLRLDNLPAKIDISDIAQVIRGGQVLEIYLRHKEKAAIVSFVQEYEAQGFYDHVRKHDLYIKAKRVQVRWNDFQKPIPGTLAWSIRGGATRNFVVQDCDPYQTPEGIKDDVEHIHELRVLSVEFHGRDCYIKTNSISGAVSARTCMSTRHRYKRCRMEWDVDDCMEAFQEVSRKNSRVVSSPSSKPARPVNRYEVLSIDRDV